MLDSLKQIALREGGIAHLIINTNLINDEVQLFTQYYQSIIKVSPPQFVKKGLDSVFDKKQIRDKLAHLHSESH